MNIITKTALSNFKKNKSRNVLIGIAIALTTLLLTVVPTALYGMIDMELSAMKNIYPSYHGMYRNVPEKDAKKMQSDAALKNVGLRLDPGMVALESQKASVSMAFYDKNTVKLGKFDLENGRFPEKADEIVVSEGILKVLNQKGEIGDKITVPYQIYEENGLGLKREKEFTITGMTKDSKESLEKNIYGALVSRAFVEEEVAKEDLVYRVYFQVNASPSVSTDEIKSRIKEIGKGYGISEENTHENSEYLMSIYVDPTLNTGTVLVMCIIVLAGILTIYSIYYVSMMDKIQEFGRLRAIGATKGQIRKLVFREGFTVAAAAIPAGLILGTAAGIVVLKAVVASGIRSDNVLTKEMEKMLGTFGISIIKPWILLLATGVAIVTVFISLLRPMQIASKISAVEALRYQGKEEGKKKKGKERKGYKELNPQKLAASNLGRNRKRTVITILTLGVTGILYMILATVLSCMNPEVMTREEIRGDVQIRIDSESGNQEHPERELRVIQQNNPINAGLKEKITALAGVNKVETQLSSNVTLEELAEENGEAFETAISGIEDELIAELKPYVLEGTLDDPKLMNGSGIILADGFIRRYSDLGLGDKVHLNIEDGEETIQKEFEIVTVIDAPSSFGGWGFTMPSSVLQGMCETSLNDVYNIFINKNEIKSVTKELKNMTAAQDTLRMRTYEEIYEVNEKGIGYMLYGCYGMLVVFGLIGILNLINTMINSVHIRRREIGVLQAIGLSDKQNINMLQLEGLFYTAGTLILSLGIGSIAGYLCYLKAKAESIMSIKVYHYPAVPAIVLVVVIVIVQFLITYLVNKSMKKQSLIDRIRYSD